VQVTEDGRDMVEFPGHRDYNKSQRFVPGVALGLLEVRRKRVAAANRLLTSIADNRKTMKIDDIRL